VIRVLVATDAWRPQVNGVVRTLEELARGAPDAGLTLGFVTPSDFTSLPMPGYPEIRLAVRPGRRLGRIATAFAPDALHIATEGPIGLAARSLALRRGLSFTTSYHTRFPEYLRERLPVPLRLTYAWLRRFHNAADGVMVATPTLEADLAARGFSRLQRWSRGVDTTLFRPRPGRALDLPRPVFLNVGRVAVEKNLEAFLSLDLPGSKMVVGDGPALAELRQRFPAARFTGALAGEALAEAYAAADVFVFPSLTDTFGLVVLEALASGLPVAAFPVMGPRDVIDDAPVGVLSADLRQAALDALAIDRAACVAFAARHSWAASAAEFAANVREGLARKRQAAGPAPPVGTK
jgi:glycosyltransferase involved in cell wall biosynthesis